MEAFNRRDVPAMLAVLAEDIEVFASPELVNSGTYRGHDGFVRWITAWTEAWEEVTADVTDNTPVGERHVVTAVHQEGRGRAGIEVSMDLAFVFGLNDQGQCDYLAMVPTPEEGVRIAEEREAS
jgi:ketosteroid isomerase-like protein